MVTQDDRRTAKRYPLQWQVCLWHEASKRFFSGTSANISRTGALLYMPLTAPINLNEKVEVNFPSPQLPESDRYPAKTFSAKVVRVNRPQSILQGRQAVALQFQ